MLEHCVTLLERVRGNSEESFPVFELHSKTIQNCVSNVRTTGVLIDREPKR
jgi:hypothetical protein